MKLIIRPCEEMDLVGIKLSFLLDFMLSIGGRHRLKGMTLAGMVLDDFKVFLNFLSIS